MALPTPTALILAAPTLFRQGLTNLLLDQWPQLVVTNTSNATQAVELVNHYAYSVVVLDEKLMGPTPPPRFLQQLLPELHRKYPEQRLLLLTKNGCQKQFPYAVLSPDHYLQLPRFVEPKALTALLPHWLHGGKTSTAQQQGLPARVRVSIRIPFSRREIEILRLVVADQCNVEIADTLCVSVRTVESHRRSMLQKAGTRTLVGLVAQAMRQGWIA